MIILLLCFVLLLLLNSYIIYLQQKETDKARKIVLNSISTITCILMLCLMAYFNTKYLHLDLTIGYFTAILVWALILFLIVRLCRKILKQRK